MPFSTFTEKDFETYLPNKWQSNVFNRDRLEVKQKLQALGKILIPDLTGADGAPLDCEVSVEYPALWNHRRVQNQHLFFSRNLDSRSELDGIISKKRSMAALIEDPSPLRNHIFLSLMIDHQQVELALKLHSDASVDRDNLDRLSQDFFAAEKLLGLINDLPAEFSVGMTSGTASDGAMTPAAELTDEGLKDLIQQLPTANSWLTIHRTLPSDDPIVRGQELVAFAGENLNSLLPIMQFVAWSRDNDYISIKETLKKKEAHKKTKGLKKGDSIRVKQGMFAGRTGQVQAVDGKGKLKVRLGTMLVNLDSADADKVKP